MFRRFESLSAQQPLTNVQANGLELSIFPWEDATVYVNDIEAMLEESYAKPWLLDEDMDASDPLYTSYLAETDIDATRFWSGEPVLCNWSFLDGSEFDGVLIEEPGYYESTQPWLF